MSYRICIMVIVFTTLLFIPNPIFADEISLLENEVQYSFISLTNGEALLISTGTDKRILINTGSKESQDELKKQLDELHVDNIDALILTNNSEDVCGNADNVIEDYGVQTVITATDELCFSARSTINIIQWKSGNLYELSAGLMFRVIKVEQSDSMSLFILFGNNSMLFMSEGSDEVEDLIRKFPARVEMLKIPEYAMKNYPSRHLLEALDPHLAVIYNIKGDQLHEGLLERLNESWIDVYHLKRVGTLHVLCNPSDYEIKK